MNKGNSHTLEYIAAKIRKSVLCMIYQARASHIGSALSVVDMLVVLYFKVLNIDPHKSKDPNRDKLLLSKGHAASALYATLAERGFFEKKLLQKYFCDQGIFPGHVDKDTVPGIEMSTGSLGHGLSVGIGLTLAHKLDNRTAHTYVIISDGELNEGSVWEAVMYAAHLKLKSLTLIIDYNKWQAYGRTNEVVNLEPLPAKFRAFNWNVIEVDGHDYGAVEKALRLESLKPKAVITHTIKGKGISFMQDKLEWHYRSPNKQEMEAALAELNERLESHAH